jgi:hypothetical protein
MFEANIFLHCLNCSFLVRYCIRNLPNGFRLTVDWNSVNQPFHCQQHCCWLTFQPSHFLQITSSLQRERERERELCLSCVCVCVWIKATDLHILKKLQKTVSCMYHLVTKEKTTWSKCLLKQKYFCLLMTYYLLTAGWYGSLDMLIYKEKLTHATVLPWMSVTSSLSSGVVHCRESLITVLEIRAGSFFIRILCRIFLSLLYSPWNNNRQIVSLFGLSLTVYCNRKEHNPM